MNTEKLYDRVDAWAAKYGICIGKMGELHRILEEELEEPEANEEKTH